MLWVDLRHYHGNIRRPAMGAVVGYHRRLRLGICLLDGLYLILCHVHGAEYKINSRRNLFHLIYIHHNQLFNSLRHGGSHLPAVSHCFLIRPAGRAGAGCHCHYLEPRMVLQKGDETLPHHACCA